MRWQILNIGVTTGTTVLKFFLNISKKEQKDRLLDRIDQPDKHWKFNVGDIKERPYWDKYMHAFEDAIANTSTEESPWFVIPGDDKHTARAIVTTIVAHELEKVKEHWPKSDAKKQAEVKEGKKLLEEES